jgi:hypothetical protein
MVDAVERVEAAIEDVKGILQKRLPAVHIPILEYTSHFHLYPRVGRMGDRMAESCSRPPEARHRLGVCPSICRR